MILLRPKQWVKNLFVIVPLLFSRKLFFLRDFSRSFAVFVLFCCVSSAVYILNDIEDAPLDKLHPTKKKRPIASGQVSVRLSYFLFFTLLIVSFVGSLLLSWYVFICFLIYVLLNVFYTFRGKKMILVDVFCIAAGFAMRVMAGSYVLNLSPSAWLIISTFFLSLFLGFSKRKAELTVSGENNHGQRPLLRLYDANLLTSVIVSTGTASIVFYALYTLDNRTVQQFGTDKLYLTVPFVCYGVFRYMLLSMLSGQEDPTDILVKDKGLWIAIGLWFLTVMLVLYTGR
ncbi:decaprenyl-phosphate phosphoribosyltransferase [Pseudothermotoga sp.]|nr:decaprenyl-phosphate phosphoribosyltransferase [Pseudothermotoga sp.]MDW8139786.1 decaprenyl-phosphate phosphoribosyltransferase [Pseudothermotoga sp.]